jgi:tRNA(Ile)-lysidine synthase
MEQGDGSWFETAGKRARYLVAVSGGADSVALLRLLLERGYRNVVVCHLDHRLRGRSSVADARFVAKLAGRFGLPVEMGRADVPRMIREGGGSMETAARNARHEFFAQCAAKWKCPRILLAHHADDQAETMLWNLLRGSHGWKGMREYHEMNVGRRTIQLIRPLLRFRRSELRGYLKSIGQPWREDASNAEGIAVRNRLRNEALPLLDEISGRDAVASILRAAADESELREFVSSYLQPETLLDPQQRLHCGALRKLPELLRRDAIAWFLRRAGVETLDRKSLDAALALLATGSASSVNLPGGKVLRRRQGRMFLG